jgi:hypothetical protein
MSRGGYGSISCVFKGGVFGTCLEKLQKTKKNLRRWNQYLDRISNRVLNKYECRGFLIHHSAISVALDLRVFGVVNCLKIFLHKGISLLQMVLLCL